MHPDQCERMMAVTIHFPADQRVAMKRHCVETLDSLGVKSPEELDVQAMTWAELGRAANDVMKRAKALPSEIKDDMSQRDCQSVEDALDALMALHDEISQEKDARTMLDDRSPRKETVDLRRRPLGVDAVARNETDDPHTKAFANWLRSPTSEGRKIQLAEAEKRLASGLTGAAGGYAIPEQLITPIQTRARDENPFRSLVRLIQVSSGDVKIPLSEGDAASGWIAEGGTRTATSEPTLAEKVPTFGTVYSLVSMTEELAMDAAVDVAQWFAEEAGRAFGEAEMNAIISGDGSAKPSGLLNVAPEAAADGSRTANALRYVASGAASTLGTAPEELLMTLYYDLKSSYRRRGTWVMNSSTAATIRKLKDSNGAFYWADSLAAGQPATLLGHPVVIAEGMDDIGTDAFPIMFGDFSRGYALCERMGMSATPDPYTNPGQIRVYLRTRIGGCVLDENAIRTIKCAAS